jgi:hypothetical protein
MIVCEQIKPLSTNDWEKFSDEIHEDICQENEAQDVSTDHMHEGTFQQKQGYIEYDVSSFEIDEIKLLSSDDHDNLVVLNVANSFSAQDDNQQLQVFFVAPNIYENFLSMMNMMMIMKF